MSNSGLTKYQDECLLILQEECGETVQEICKITRFGLNKISHHTVGKSHLECLTQELGDLLAMIQMVAESGIGVTEAGLKQAMANKLAKVKLWMYNKPEVALAPQNKVVKAKKPSAKAKKKAIKKTIGTEIVMQKALELAQHELGNYKRGKEDDNSTK